jgi:hypothetical protein
MFKYLFYIVTTATIGYFAWQKLNVVKAPRPTQVTTQATTQKEATKEIIKENTFKNADLHDAFSKILEKEKANKKKARRHLTIDELIALNLKIGSTEMTGLERKLVIKKLKLDITKLEKKYAFADASVDEKEIELKIGQKKEQLENFEYIESQSPGVNFEN